MTPSPQGLKAYLKLCQRLGIRYLPGFPSSNVSANVPRSEVKAGRSDKTGPTHEASPAPGLVSEDERNTSTAVALSTSSTAMGQAAQSHWMTGSADTLQAMELTAFDRDICECQNCPLGRTRKHFVFGSGNPQAEVMFVGEAPGADEDAQGLPFVGAAGKLLTKIIESTKTWKREDVFICNVLKCRPPGNRTPLPEEVEACRPYLEEQIRIIKPKLIMALGASAAQALLKTKDSVGKLRNKWHDFQGISLRVTYHPAALLRFEGYKKDVWEDMKELTAQYRVLKGLPNT